MPKDLELFSCILFWTYPRVVELSVSRELWVVDDLKLLR